MINSRYSYVLLYFFINFSLISMFHYYWYRFLSLSIAVYQDTYVYQFRRQFVAISSICRTDEAVNQENNGLCRINIVRFICRNYFAIGNIAGKNVIINARNKWIYLRLPCEQDHRYRFNTKNTGRYHFLRNIFHFVTNLMYFVFNSQSNFLYRIL